MCSKQNRKIKSHKVLILDFGWHRNGKHGPNLEGLKESEKYYITQMAVKILYEVYSLQFCNQPDGYEPMFNLNKHQDKIN